MNQSTEMWKPVVGYEGIYEVSDLGNVRGVDRIDAAGRRWKGRPLSPKMHSGGYFCVNLSKNAQRSMKFVHRLVLEAFVGPCLEGRESLHGPTGQTDNRLVNLRWGTHGENLSDRIAHGTHPETSKEACPRGHALVAPNLVPWAWRDHGHRKCRSCSQEHSYAHYRGIPFSKARADERYRLLTV